MDKFTYFGSSISSTEKDINMHLAKAWTAIDKFSNISKSNLSDKIKSDFFQTAVAQSACAVEYTNSFSAEG